MEKVSATIRGHTPRERLGSVHRAIGAGLVPTLVVVARRFGVCGAADALALLATDDAFDRLIDVIHVLGAAGVEAAAAPHHQSHAGVGARLYVVGSLHTSHSQPVVSASHPRLRGSGIGVFTGRGSR